MKRVRAFTPRVERQIADRFGIMRPVTDAVRLMQAGRANTARWLANRTRTIGASEIGVLMMSHHPYHSPFSLWHMKAHGRGRFPQSDAQERGHLLEPGIARRFADAHPHLVVAPANGALWADPQSPWLSCSPDYLTIDADGLIVPLELKSDEGGDDWTWDDEGIPEHHWWQITQQCGVFAAPYGYVARWNTRGYRDYRIGFDPDLYDRSAGVARAFLDSVAAGVEPDLDGHSATAGVLKEMYPDAAYPLAPVRVPDEWGAELEALKTSAKEIDKQIAALTNRIRGALGEAPVGFDLAGRTHHRVLQPRKAYAVKATVIDKLTMQSPKSGD